MIDPELFNLIPKIDLSTHEKIAAFKKWQHEDGTIEGLRKLYEVQQSVQRTGSHVCETVDIKTNRCIECGAVQE